MSEELGRMTSHSSNINYSACLAVISSKDLSLVLFPFIISFPFITLMSVTVFWGLILNHYTLNDFCIVHERNYLEFLLDKNTLYTFSLRHFSPSVKLRHNLHFFLHKNNNKKNIFHYHKFMHAHKPLYLLILYIPFTYKYTPADGMTEKKNIF